MRIQHRLVAIVLFAFVLLSSQVYAFSYSFNSSSTIKQPEKILMGITQKNDILIIRALAHRAEPIRNQFEHIWQLLRPSVYGREACTPRIWNT